MEFLLGAKETWLWIHILFLLLLTGTRSSWSSVVEQSEHSWHQSSQTLVFICVAMEDQCVAEEMVVEEG